jgi:hypothetical protein
MPDTGELVEVIDQKAAAPLLKERGVGMQGTQGSDTERERRAQVKRESPFRWKLFEAIRQKSPATLARQDLEQVALMGSARHGFDARKRLLKVWEWKKGKGYDGDLQVSAWSTDRPNASRRQRSAYASMWKLSARSWVPKRRRSKGTPSRLRRFRSGRC